MKKVIAALAVSLAAFAFSQEQGVSVDVELLSGTKQHAQFLGIANDTVQLGGYIQNKFTILRIPKDKFKSIKDSVGNDMLNAPAEAVVASAQDSAGAVTDSLAADSLAADSAASSEFASMSILVAFDTGDSADGLAAQMTALTARLLLEGDEQIRIFRRQEFASCNDDICIRNTLSSRGAKTVYLGKISDGSTVDSISFELTRAVFEDSLPEMHKAQMSLSRKSALSDALKDNPALLYAAIRNTLYRKGYKVEILENFVPQLKYISEWWKQLYGESEGKEGKGILPHSLSFTTDLHSMGQYVQEGERLMFETVLSLEQPQGKVAIPADDKNLDGINYLLGKSLTEINHNAEIGTIMAHNDGGVPVLRLLLPNISEYTLGQLIYFFEFACGVSGYTLGVNPFDQPGVEAYKKNMFRLLGKPGYENK